VFVESDGTARWVHQGRRSISLPVECKKAERLLVQIRESPQFGDVDRAFAGFALVHERVRHSQTQRDFTLRQSTFDARGNQSRQDTLVVGPQLRIAPLPGAPRVGFRLSCHTLKCGEVLTNPLIRDTLKRVVGRRNAAMENSKVEFPEVIGKSVAELSIYEDDVFGREFLLRFSDGTQLSVCVGVRQSIDARYCKEDSPDTPIFTRQD